MRESRAEKNYVSETYFRMWVRAMYDQFMESSAVTQTRKNYTYVYLRSKVGTAKCNTIDEWDTKTGIAYAWARCTGQPEYYIEKTKYVPKAGDWVYVTTVNNKTRYLKFIAEGVDNYCFKMRCDSLTLIDKDKVTNITCGE